MFKNNKTLLASILLGLVQLSCTAASNDISPTLNKDAFPGFTISSDNVALDGYDFKNHDRNEIIFNSCKSALDYNIDDIATHDYFRFKLLLVSCMGINKYHDAKNSNKSFFPSKLSDEDYKNFPALATPFLSETEYAQRLNKTISQAYKTLKVTSKDKTATLMTKEDEIYITVLARGDFNNDKIEDLLVTSEWYAINAHGKHTELVVLSKTDKDEPVKIDWRMNTLKR